MRRPTRALALLAALGMLLSALIFGNSPPVAYADPIPPTPTPTGTGTSGTGGGGHTGG